MQTFQKEQTVWSWSEYLELARKGSRFRSAVRLGETTWTGGVNFRQALELGEQGWHDQTQVTLDVARQAIATVQQTSPFRTFDTLYGVEGCDVDVGRYLSGDPECMISYPLRNEDRRSRVIKLCYSCTCSGGVSAETLQRRGAVITAFAHALSVMGYSLEIWADRSDTYRDYRMRVLVKAASEPWNISRMSFALGHPAMLRQLGFAVGALAGCTGVTPADPTEDLGENVIYLPTLNSPHDIPDADVMLKDLLRKAGLFQ